MSPEERTAVFLESMDRANSPFLQELEKQARLENVPIIRPGTQSFIRTLLALKKPERILEIGCAVGFSALLMAENTPEKTRIATIEKDPERIRKAAENIRAAGMEKRITVLSGDADEILPTLETGWDFIFMDAAKAQYPVWLPTVRHLLKKGGVLLSDNVLREGELIESHYAVERRNRTIYKRMRQYLQTLTHDEAWETTILPVGDGLALSVKK
jgi:predicted O-methyltransferase YrrM